MPDNVNITVNETIENVVINPSISTDVIDFNITSTTENVTIDVTPNLTTVNINSISGSPVTKTSDLTNDGEDGIHPFITIEDVPAGGLTSVGLTMPIAFSVANSPLTSDGTIAVTGAGTSSQYIRGDGQLATMPSGGGGGSSVNYYLNGSIAASVATYKQLSNTAIIGGGTDFSLTGNGLITQFLTDVGNPNRIEIPGGAWNFEMWFSMSSNGGTPKFYVELLKYNGTTFTTIASSSAVPETINGGTTIDLYLTSLAVPTTTLLSTDRLAIRVYIVNNSGGRTATLHTEDNHLCEILTTFSGGVTSLNGLTANTQYLAVGTTGTDFNINSLVETHTFNLPTASATNRGALSTTDWTAFNGKFTLPALTSGSVLFSNGTTIAQDNSNFFWDDTNNRLGINNNVPFTGLTSVYGLDIGDNLSSNYGNLNVRGYSSLGGFSTSSYGGVGSNYCLNSTGNIIRRFNDRVSLIDFAAGGFVFKTSGTGAVGSSISLTELMRLNTNGNLLINTTTDNGGKLQIKAPGALSTDIALRVRNSADSGDLMTVNGLGNATLSATFTANNLVASQNVNFGNILYGTNFYSVSSGATTIGALAAANASAMLDIVSTTKGFLPPRMTNAQRIAIATPAVGLCVYCTDVVEGLYINKSTGWTYIG